MLQTTQTLQPASTASGAGAMATHFANHAPSRLVDDRETLYKEFARRLHALVWCEGQA